MNALDRLPPPIPTAICPAPEPGQAFVLLGVDNTCTACGVCAKACPTGALQVLYDDESRGFEILYAPRACTGCETCLHLCDPEALHRRRVPLFREFLAAPGRIHSGVFHVCEACGARFAGRAVGARVVPALRFPAAEPVWV